MKPINARMYVNVDMKEIDSMPLAGGWVSIFTAMGPHKERANEDAAALIPTGDDTGIILVADGVGGWKGAAEASKIVVESVVKEVRRSREKKELLREGILRGIKKANQIVLKLELGAATTVLVAEIHGKTVCPYQVGDSLMFNFSGKGEAKYQSTPHSPVGYAVGAGKISEKEALLHDDLHLVSNVVGIEDMRVEEGSPFTMAQTDTLVLSTDGLSDNLFIEEIAQASNPKSSPEKIMVKLAADVLKRMLNPKPGLPSKPDDLTIVLFRQNRS